MASTLQIGQPVRRRKCDEAPKAEAIHLAQESRSKRAAQQLGISEKLLHYWQWVQAEANSGRHTDRLSAYAF